MNALRINVPLPRLLGPNDVFQAPGSVAILGRLPATRLAVIASPRAAAQESVEKLLRHDHSFEICAIHPSWSSEPTLEELSATVAELEQFSPDWIAAIGGGSVLDGAKLCWTLLEHPRLDRHRLDIPFALPALRRRARFAAVPTTAGTGSEASSSAVYFDRKRNSKVLVVSHDFLPDVALLDPELTLSLSPRLTAVTALDALSHAVEGYASTQLNPLVDCFAVQAVRLILGAIENVALRSDDMEARAQVMNGAFLAGYVQNLRLVGPAHAIAHQLGGLNVPHGLATGLLLPEVIQFNCGIKDTASLYTRLAKEAGLPNADALLSRLKAIPEMFGVDRRLSSWPGAAGSVSDEEIGGIASRAASDRLLSRVFPRPLAPGQAVELFREVW